MDGIYAAYVDTSPFPSLQVGNVSVMMEKFDLPVEFRDFVQSRVVGLIAVQCFPIPKGSMKTNISPENWWLEEAISWNKCYLFRGQGGVWRCTYIYHKFQPNLGKYSSPMGHMGYGPWLRVYQMVNGDLTIVDLLWYWNHPLGRGVAIPWACPTMKNIGQRKWPQ